MNQKKVPQRMCIVCKQMLDKRDLVRIVRTTEGEILVDLSGKMNGRGAYICKNSDCAEKCLKTKALNRVFKGEIPAEKYQNVLEALEKCRQTIK